MLHYKIRPINLSAWLTHKNLGYLLCLPLKENRPTMENFMNNSSSKKKNYPSKGNIFAVKSSVS